MRVKVLLLMSILSLSSHAGWAADVDDKVSLERGIQTFEAGQNKEAQTFFQDAINHNPNNDQAHMWLGKTFEEDKYSDRALKEYQKSLILNPKNADANFLAGRIYFNQKDYKNSQGYLEKAVSQNSSNAPAYAMLGQMYAEQKEDSKAKAAYKKAIKIDPSIESARIGMMELELRGKKPDQMIRELEAIKLDFPKNSRARNLLARAYEDNGDNDSAIREYSDTIRRESDNRDAWFGIGEVLERTNRLSQSQVAYQKAQGFGYDVATHQSCFRTCCL